ncbi:hypothetical protein FB451DRAFT_1391099 [Mycena latifolia]|nr:hypothetical protein FB451DRAFT_1391099 [Mycena latifolia]
MCQRCDDLDRWNDFLYEIRDRIANGVDENTPLIFYPVGGLIQKLRKEDGQLSAMRLTKLNDTRMLAGKIAQLDLHKQLMMAMVTSDVHQVSQLLRSGINNGERASARYARAIS